MEVTYRTQKRFHIVFIVFIHVEWWLIYLTLPKLGGNPSYSGRSWALSGLMSLSDKNNGKEIRFSIRGRFCYITPNSLPSSGCGHEVQAGIAYTICTYIDNRLAIYKSVHVHVRIYVCRSIGDQHRYAKYMYIFLSNRSVTYHTHPYQISNPSFLRCFTYHCWAQRCGQILHTQTSRKTSKKSTQDPTH